MKPSLLILAAGAASRYGGLKQLEPLGPSGETIMEYSIYDALNAGFGKVVFIIRKEFRKEFEAVFSQEKTQNEFALAFQEVNPKFEGIKNVAMREKPWGTVHALLAASEHLNKPFAVINADDFYGKKSFKLMSEFLKNHCAKNHWLMVGYKLENTLSTHGGVTRGVCEIDQKRLLKKVKECRGVQKNGTEIFYNEGDTKILLDENSIVSMNFWGFHPHFFELAEKRFKKFLSENANNPKAEMTIPDLVQPLVESGVVGVSVLNTNEEWFGITYKEDRESVISELEKLAGAGAYPKKMWNPL